MAARTYTFQNGQTADGGQVETEFNEIYTNITNANIGSGAAIAYSKLNLALSIVNADVSTSAAIDISKTTLGTYTTWATWAPTYSASGSMTLSSVSTSLARWCQIGKVVFFEINTTMTTSGTASNAIRFTPPVAPANTADNSVGGGCWVVDTTSIAGYWGYQNASATFQCFKYDVSNFGLGASRRIKVQGFYEVA